MKKELLITLIFIFAIFMFNFSSAEEMNYSVNPGYEGLQISSLKYESYPVNPGEYFDIWIKANLGNNNYVKFSCMTKKY